MGWFQSPRNVAFTIIGWLYGESDFGKSICIAVNCGDDTDCTGATMGSLFGIISGTKAIPEKWEVSGLPADTLGVDKDGKKTLDLSILANAISLDTIRLSLLLTRGTDSDSIPFNLFKKKL